MAALRLAVNPFSIVLKISAVGIGLLIGIQGHREAAEESALKCERLTVWDLRAWNFK